MDISQNARPRCSAPGAAAAEAPRALPARVALGALPPGSYREPRYAVAATAHSFDTSPPHDANLRALLSQALRSVLAHQLLKEAPDGAPRGEPRDEPTPGEMAEALVSAVRPSNDPNGDPRALRQASLALVEGAELGYPWMTLEGAAPLL